MGLVSRVSSRTYRMADWVICDGNVSDDEKEHAPPPAKQIKTQETANGNGGTAVQNQPNKQPWVSSGWGPNIGWGNKPRQAPPTYQKPPQPTGPTDLWEYLCEELSNDDSKSLCFFSYNYDKNEQALEVYLNGKRYYSKALRKLPFCVKEAMARYILTQYGFGRVTFENKPGLENALQAIYNWDSTMKFAQIEPLVSFEVNETSEVSTTITLEVDDEEKVKTVASSVEKAKDIACKQMLNSEEYRQKYIDLLKKEFPTNDCLNGPVIEKFGSARNDPHIRKRLTENPHLDVIWKDYALSYMDAQIEKAKVLYDSECHYYPTQWVSNKMGYRQVMHYCMFTFDNLVVFGLDQHRPDCAKKEAQAEMIRLIEFYNKDFSVDVPLRHWQVLSSNNEYHAAATFDFTQSLQIFNYFEVRPNEDSIKKNKYLCIQGEPWCSAYLNYNIHKASQILKEKVVYDQKISSECTMKFGDYMRSVGCGKAVGQAKLCAQIQLAPYIEAKYKIKFDKIAIVDWQKKYTEWLAENNLTKL